MLRDRLYAVLKRLAKMATPYLDGLLARLEDVRIIQQQHDAQLTREESLRLCAAREMAAARQPVPVPVKEDLFVLPWTARAAQIAFNKKAEEIRDRSDIVTMQRVLDRAQAKAHQRPDRGDVPDTPRPTRKKYIYP